MNATYGWHFTVNGRLRDGAPLPAIGRRISLPDDAPLILCDSGFHFSEHPADALRYCPSGVPQLNYILAEDYILADDKGCARHRTIVASLSPDDTVALLRYYARLCALHALPQLESHISTEVFDTIADFLMTGENAAVARATAARATEAAAAKAAAKAAAWAAQAGEATEAAWAAWAAARATAEAAWAAEAKEELRDTLSALVNDTFGI